MTLKFSTTKCLDTAMIWWWIEKKSVRACVRGGKEWKDSFKVIVMAVMMDAGGMK